MCPNYPTICDLLAIFIGGIIVYGAIRLFDRALTWFAFTAMPSFVSRWSKRRVQDIRLRWHRAADKTSGVVVLVVQIISGLVMVALLGLFVIMMVVGAWEKVFGT